MPTCMEPTCLRLTLPSGTGRGSPPCLFPPRKVLSRLTCFSSAGPSPFPSFSGAGHQEADLGRRGQNSCWFSYRCGPGASRPEAVAQCQGCPSCQGLGRRGAELAATPREGMLLPPFRSPPRLLLLPPLPRSPATESPPDKDFTFHSGLRSQRLTPKLFRSTVNMSGERGG